MPRFAYCAFLFLILAACGGDPEPFLEKTPSRMQVTAEQEAAWRAMSHDPERIAAGKKLYHSQRFTCVQCHRPDGLGMAPLGPNLRDDYWIYGSDMGSIIESIAYGRRKGLMPGLLPHTSMHDIESLAAYIADWNRREKANGQGWRRSDTDKVDPIDY